LGYALKKERRMSMGQSYRDAGVDVERGYQAVSRIKGHARATFSRDVLSDLGGFNALFSLAKAKEMEDPVLASGTDGVGTKLKVAFVMDKHDTVGIDCVAMCVNDIVCCGAEPLFFLDYIACGKNSPSVMERIVKGMSDGCLMAGCSLVGGEMAEMPGFYESGEYDLAGFAVGLVDRPKMITGKGVLPGDVVIGLGSSGLHSNGFSLVRSVLRLNESSVAEHVVAIGRTLGLELLEPTRIYVKSILEVRKKVNVKACCHITGGGFYENMPRMLPGGLGLAIEKGTWKVHPIFDLVRQAGDISEKDMYQTFNMGIGMAIVVSPEEAEEAVYELTFLGENAKRIGLVEEGAGVRLC
jgi:phosphoribosylformylglycinamidine cyclo-ligase